MNSTIYGCPKCKQTFLESNDTPKICSHCNDGTQLILLESEWELDCGQCNMPTNVFTYESHGKLKRIKPGLLTCKYCTLPLKWK